jgi:hypothetical protein
MIVVAMDSQGKIGRRFVADSATAQVDSIERWTCRGIEVVAARPAEEEEARERRCGAGKKSKRSHRECAGLMSIRAADSRFGRACRPAGKPTPNPSQRAQKT